MITVTAVGRLGADPETRTTAAGKTVGDLRLASKEGKDNTEWVRVVMWEKDAEYAAKYLRKGDVVAVTGRLQTRKWQDKEGQDRYTTELVASRVEGFGSKGAEDSEEKPF
jgi:single-strand DNA-binding protein